jgi:hypothetical protein
MTTVTIELQPELYARLAHEARLLGRPIETLVAEWLARRFPEQAPPGERSRAIAVLREAGLLTEPGPDLKQQALQATLTTEEILAVGARIDGRPLSELVLEQRGPKA